MIKLKEFIKQFNEAHASIPDVLFSNELTFEVVTTGKNRKDAKVEAYKMLARAKIAPPSVKVKLERNLLIDKENDDWSWIVRVQGEPTILNQLRKFTDQGQA